MTDEKITSTVYKILIESFDIDTLLLKPEARLNEDLGLDSLDGVDLVVAIEEKFNCRIPEEEVRAMRTLEDICANIKQHGKLDS